MHDLFCGHEDGKQALIDRLSTGELNTAEQQTLYMLIQKMVDLPNFFKIEQVAGYETQSDGIGQYIEYWVCPVCGNLNSDIRDTQPINNDEENS